VPEPVGGAHRENLEVAVADEGAEVMPRPCGRHHFAIGGEFGRIERLLAGENDVGCHSILLGKEAAVSEVSGDHSNPLAEMRRHRQVGHRMVPYPVPRRHQDRIVRYPAWKTLPALPPQSALRGSFPETKSA
jgi:hypothetical protein